MAALIRQRMEFVAEGKPVDFELNDSVCRQVSNRASQLRDFAAGYDVILFVGGKKSSNGMILYSVCKEVNPDSYLVSSPDELNRDWFRNAASVGICGATSTPGWLMKEVEKEILKMNQ